MECDRCKGPLGDPVSTNIPDWMDPPSNTENALSVQLWGSYGEFIDNTLDLSKPGGPGPNWTRWGFRLCHDCAASLLSFLNLPPEEYSGGHPYPDDGSECCEYGYHFPT
jgi:hypothetical protein